MKSAYYVATVVKAYRDALDAYYDGDGTDSCYDDKYLGELNKASHREYTTGFYFGKPSGNDQIYHTSSYVRDYTFIGIVLEYNKETGVAKIEQRNRMFKNETIEVMRKTGDFFSQNIEWMKNEDGEEIDVAPNPQMIIYMPMDKEVEPFSILRRED